jgi:hypothetical protein
MASIVNTTLCAHAVEFQVFGHWGQGRAIPSAEKNGDKSLAARCGHRALPCSRLSFLEPQQADAVLFAKNNHSPVCGNRIVARW